MVKMKESRWILLFISLLLVSFFYWFEFQSRLGESILLTVLSVGTPVYLCYYLKKAKLQWSKHVIQVIASATGAVICLHALLAVFAGLEENAIQVFTALTYLAVLLLLWLVVMVTLQSLYSVVRENPIFSAGALISGFIFVFILNIPQTIGRALLLVVQHQTISLQWYEPLSLIFLVQMALAAFLLPFQIRIKWTAKQRENTLPLLAVSALAINGLIGAVTVFALYFQ
ncbi:hypothetical protein L4D06_23940 [Enterovibrio makurazakiensis]|uniref:hypothetical protein n=1 Tax=Enterovibrio makurazakiensis TaxID=2910232 RepID=UPI003D1E20A7